jgi:hypothetical protein
MAQRALPKEEVADRLGVAQNDVAGLVERGRVEAGLPPTIPLREAVATGGVFMVERPEDPEEGDDLFVSFSDRVKFEFDELIWECTAFIDSLPGVTDTIREDRDLIVVTGTIELEVLQTELTRWWTDRLQ